MATVLAFALSLVAAAGPGGTATEPQRSLSPFLEAFKGTPEPALVGREVTFPTATGRVSGFVARPDTKERLPAVLLIPASGGEKVWLKERGRELASVGYVVLAVDVEPPAGGAEASEERTLADLSAAVRWLRRRPDVLPEQLGVVGWAWGGGQALTLAANAPLQACVVCDGPVTTDPAQLAGLKGTPVLGIFAGTGQTQALPAFDRALAAAGLPHKIEVYDGARPGFMGPDARVHNHDAAERAWVAVYEFLGHHVEDAGRNGPTGAGAPQDVRPVATIADLMRAVNDPGGVRGAVRRGLEQEPSEERGWDRVRANAAVLAEAGRLLERQRPPRGSERDWREQTRAYTASAEAIMTAADRHDRAAARRGLEDLDRRCGLCHEQHR